MGLQCASVRGLQIPEDQWEDVRNTVLRMLAGVTSKSSKPAIFGAAPVPDDGGPRRPLGSAREGDAVALEVAAAEMAQSASTLVAIERTIMALSQKGVCSCHVQSIPHPLHSLIVEEQHDWSRASHLARRPIHSSVSWGKR